MPDRADSHVIVAASAAVSERMSRQPSRNTRPEVLLRSILHRSGFRFRLHQRPVKDLPRQADIVFRRARVAVFVDGCFWHGCPEHASWPKNNADWWRRKIEVNRLRDADTDRRLRDAGWYVVRVWEHDDPAHAAEQIEEVVRRRAT